MTDALAWALIHFVWQGTVIAALVWVCRRLAGNPESRYAVGVAALATMAAVFVVTVFVLTPGSGTDGVSAPRAAAVSSLDSPLTANASGDAAPPAVLPSVLMVALWGLGVAMLSIRAYGGWLVARRLTRIGIAPVADPIAAAVVRMTSELGITHVVRVLESRLVAAPVMVGWLAPVVLVPTAALTGLSAAQIEAVIAHELAHIRRNDYLVNIIQTIVETLFFFHPAVWWVSRCTRNERELCCDDVALGLTDRMTYATALQTLAQLNTPALALAATDGSLVDRIRRIVSPPVSSGFRGGWIAMLPLMLVLSIATPSATTNTPVAVVPVSVSGAVVESERPVAQAKPVPSQYPVVKEVPVEVEPEPLRKSPRQIEVERARERTVRAQVDAAKLDLDAAQRRLARVRALVERNLATHTQRDAEEIEVLRRAQEVKALEAQLPIDVEPVEVSVSRTLGGNETLAAGDALNITVDGEPAMAPVRVAADGTVRLLFLGSIDVAGRTTADVSKTIVQAIQKRGLVDVPVVSVTATRRR